MVDVFVYHFRSFQNNAFRALFLFCFSPFHALKTITLSNAPPGLRSRDSFCNVNW